MRLTGRTEQRKICRVGNNQFAQKCANMPRKIVIYKRGEKMLSIRGHPTKKKDLSSFAELNKSNANFYLHIKFNTLKTKLQYRGTKKF